MIHYWLSKIVFLDFMKPLGIWYLFVIIISNGGDSNSNIYWAELFEELLKLGLQLYQKSKLIWSSRVFSARIYCFKVNNGKIKTMCKIFSKLTIKIPDQCQWHHSCVFILNFEQISHIVPVFQLLTSNKGMPDGLRLVLHVLYITAKSNMSFEYLLGAVCLTHIIANSLEKEWFKNYRQIFILSTNLEWIRVGFEL